MRSEFAEIDFESQDVIIGRIDRYERADILKELYEGFRGRSGKNFETIVTDSSLHDKVVSIGSLLSVMSIYLYTSR